MAEPPSVDGHEITDKGYINQRATLERRKALVDRLYAGGEGVIVIGVRVRPRMIYFLAAVAAIAGFLFGYDEGVIAVVRPSLDKDFPMGPLVGGFMTAAVPLGALVAASVAGRIVDRFGRRRVLMAAAALFALGALVAASITAIWMLVAGPSRPGTGDRRRGGRRTALHRRNRAASDPRRPGLDLPAGDHHRHPGVLPDRPGGLGRRHVADAVRAGRRAGTAVSRRTGLSARIAALARAQGVARRGPGQPAAPARPGLGRRRRARRDGPHR